MENVQFTLLQGDLSVNKGILENAIARQLYSNGLLMYYYNSLQHGEGDFVVQQYYAPLPLEVKFDNDYTPHYALGNILSVAEWGIPKSYAFFGNNL